MPQSNLCIRMDENLKKQFDHLCDELGLTMSTAINIFVKKMNANSKNLVSKYFLKMCSIIGEFLCQ